MRRKPASELKSHVTNRPGYRSRTVVLSVKLPLQLVEEIDRLIEDGLFQSRSDLIRYAVRKVVAEMCYNRKVAGMTPAIR